MAQIQSIVSRSIEQSIAEIASNAARAAAVTAMQSSSQNESSLTTADHPAATSDCNPGPSAAMAVPDFLPNMANTPENESFVSQTMPRYGHAAWTSMPPMSSKYKVASFLIYQSYSCVNFLRPQTRTPSS